jgi:hypothetical protein
MPVTETLRPPVHEVLTTPASTKTVDDPKVEIADLPIKTERPMLVKQPEKDLGLPVLTLPEPVAHVHLNPYVEEALTIPHSELATTIPVPRIEVPIYDRLPPMEETAEGLPMEPVAILTESMSAEIAKIIGSEPTTEVITTPAPWLELASEAPQRELEKGPTPIEAFTYFTQSLDTWHESSVSAQTMGEETVDGSGIAVEQLMADLPEADKKAMVAISHEVAEHLQGLEPAEVEEVSSVIAEINTTITKVQELLHPETAEDLALLEEAKQELETLCEELFDTLGIEHDELSINYFVQIMLLKQFRGAMDIAAYKDRLGTHEFKHHFPPFGVIAQIIAGEVFHFVLGRLALLQTKPQERSLAQSS